jgi:hypothetical protein
MITNDPGIVLAGRHRIPGAPVDLAHPEQDFRHPLVVGILFQNIFVTPQSREIRRGRR